MKLRLNKLIHSYKNESNLFMIITENNMVGIEISGFLGKNFYSIKKKYLNFKKKIKLLIKNL